MSRRVLLITGNFFPEPTGIGKYSGEMIDWLSENGYYCTVITTFPYYPQWRVQDEYVKARFWYKKETRHSTKASCNPITIIRCPHYIPTSPTGMKRLLSEFTISFFSYLALFCLLFNKKFDYVMTVAPPFELGILGALYKKIRGGKFLYHIQDLQVDAARELGMITSKIILKFLFALEKYIIKKADIISTISEGMIKRIKTKCNKDVILFPNWVDTNFFYPIENKSLLKLSYGFKETDKIVLYSGAIGEKQGLISMIHIANNLKNHNSIKFVICGSGPYKNQLVALNSSLGLKNLIFLPLQPGKSFNYFLNMADVHLILQKANAADLFMPSKLSTILATGGLPIVTASPGTSLYTILNSFNIGIVISPEHEEELEQAVEFSLKGNFSNKNYNARTYAVKNFSINEVLSKFASIALSDKKNIVDEGKNNNKFLVSG